MLQLNLENGQKLKFHSLQLWVDAIQQGIGHENPFTGCRHENGNFLRELEQLLLTLLELGAKEHKVLVGLKQRLEGRFGEGHCDRAQGTCLLKHDIEAGMFIINILVKTVTSESIGGGTMTDGDWTCNLNIIPSMK